MTIQQELPKFVTIRQAAKMGILSEHHLRILVKNGEIPGLYTGNRFMVNVPLLLEKLDRASMEVRQ